MVEVVRQFIVSKNKNIIILHLNTNILDLQNDFNYIEIDGIRYKPEICYDTHSAIAIEANGNFVGKEVKFI